MPFKYDLGLFLGLPLTKHIKIAQSNRFHAIELPENFGVQLVYVLANGIGGKRVANEVFYLGQAGVVAISGRTGRVYEAFNAGFLCGGKDVYKAAHIDLIRAHRVVNRAGHGAKGRLMKDVANALNGLLAGFKLADIPFYKPEIFTPECAFKVLSVAGGKVIQTNNFIADG